MAQNTLNGYGLTGPLFGGPAGSPAGSVPLFPPSTLPAKPKRVVRSGFSPDARAQNKFVGSGARFSGYGSGYAGASPQAGMGQGGGMSQQNPSSLPSTLSWEDALGLNGNSGQQGMIDPQTISVPLQTLQTPTGTSSTSAPPQLTPAQLQERMAEIRKNLTEPGYNAAPTANQSEGILGDAQQDIGNLTDNWVTFGLGNAAGNAWGDVDSGHGSRLKAESLTGGLLSAILFAGLSGGGDAVAGDVAERGLAATARPGGLLLKKAGGYWIKTVNPNASRIMQWYARKTLDGQAAALGKLGDMAPKFIYKGGKLIVRDVGKYEGSFGQYLKIWAQGSRRLGTIFNDIKRRNMGANGEIFDPALQPGWPIAVAGGVGGGLAAGWGYNEHQQHHGR